MKKVFSVIGAFIFLVLLGSMIGNCFSDSSQGHENSDAIVQGEQYMKDNLKSPSSAKFSNESVTKDGEDFIVEGDVDSQNSFGAMMRTHYKMKLDKNLKLISGIDHQQQ